MNKTMGSIQLFLKLISNIKYNIHIMNRPIRERMGNDKLNEQLLGGAGSIIVTDRFPRMNIYALISTTNYQTYQITQKLLRWK